ncbi:hypothetical protein RQP46_001894 [Phenoliferia psychrophenolica]
MHATAVLLYLGAALPVVLATMSQGHTNYTRDYQIQYTGYADTEAFCHEWHTACVAYAGPRNAHHVLDCVFDQPGPIIFAFCGSAQKDAKGNWSPALNPDVPIMPHTVDMIHTVPNATLVADPTGAAIDKRNLFIPSTHKGLGFKNRANIR